MKIRQKMLIMELSTAAAFIIAITLFFLFLSNITTLKNLEIQSQKVLNKLNYINYRTSKLINSRYNFGEMDLKWNESISEYSNDLILLRENPSIGLIGEKLTIDIEFLNNRWQELGQERLNDFKLLLDKVAKDNLKSKVGQFTFDYASAYNDIGKLLNINDAKLLSEFIYHQRIVSREFNNYTTIMRTLMGGINNEIKERINFTLLLIAALLLLIMTGTLFAALIYAGGLSKQIKLIERTAKEVTDGNFNIKLDVHGSDEFKSLSQNFNLFTEMLWSRLDAVRTIMKEMGEISGEIEDLKAVEQEILNLAIKSSTADAGVIYLYDSEEDILKPSLVQGKFPPPYAVSASITQNPEKAFAFLKEHAITPGESIIGKVASQGKAIFIKDTEKSRDLPTRWSNDPLHISSFMAIPLLVSNNVLGVFALVKTAPEEFFSDLSFTNMKTFGEYTALSIDNRYKYLELKEKFELSRELSIATEIQQGLQLKKIPQFKKLQLSSYHNSAKGISGDYFDIFNISESKTAVILCDVAGKGIPAALVMVMIRTILRVIAHADRDAGTMLTLLNENISGKVGTDQYATMGVVIIDNKTGELTFTNAAHLPLHIYRKENDRFEEFVLDSVPVGLEKKTQYKQKHLSLNPGDMALIYTDGIAEARNIHGIEFSSMSLLREIKKHAEKNTDEIAEIVSKEMEIFLRGAFLYDDQSMLIMKYEG